MGALNLEQMTENMRGSWYPILTLLVIFEKVLPPAE